MPNIFLSIGSNVDRDKNIPSALRSLEKEFGHLTLSNVYESEAVGFIGDPFFNMVVKFNSDLAVHNVAQVLREIEFQHGRSRTCGKFSARALDIDLILYGNLVLKENKLELPREDIIRYAFVLEPLAEIAPNIPHPVTGESFMNLWQQFDKTKLVQHRIKTSWL